MIGILTIFGILWIFQGIRDYCMTEKFAEQKKGIAEQYKMEYTKGLGKFELLVGGFFLLFDRVIARFLEGKYTVMLFFVVMIFVLVSFSKWSKKYREDNK